MSGMWERYRNRRSLARCNSVGRDVVIEGEVFIANPGRITLGDGVHVRSTPVVSHLVTGPVGTLTIGRDVVIGHGAAIASHEAITIGDGAQLGPFAMLMDTDFHETGEDDSGVRTAAIHIGARARLGARVTVLRGTTIGADAWVAAGSVVKGDVPSGARVGGNPARPILDVAAAMSGDEVSMADVQQVVAHTFGLATVPEPGTRRDAIAQWDSLGMLNLLLSLEQAFDISLRDEAMLRVGTVGDLLELVQTARGDAPREPRSTTATASLSPQLATAAIMHHVGYAVRSIEESAPRYAQQLGTTWDGKIDHDPIQQARVTFLVAGNGLAGAPQVELIEGDSADAPLTRFVAKGGGLHHLCYEVRDLDNYLEMMRAQGAAFIKAAAPAVAFDGRRVAWMLAQPNLLLEYLEIL